MKHTQPPAPMHYSSRQALDTDRRAFNRGSLMVQTAITAVICMIIVAETFSTNLLLKMSMEVHASNLNDS